MIDFDDDKNQFVNTSTSGKIFDKIKSFYFKFKRFVSKFIPKITDEKQTTKFYLSVCIVVFICGYLFANAYVMPYVLPQKHNDIIIPDYHDNNINQGSYIIITPVPTVTVKPDSDNVIAHAIVNDTGVKPIVDDNPSGIIGYTGSVKPGNQPEIVTKIDYDDIDKMKADESNMLYTDNLALNIGYSDLGSMHYHVNDLAYIKLNIANIKDDTITNLKGYVSVRLHNSNFNLIDRKLLYEESVNIPARTNYIKDFNINIPNYKGNYDVVLEVDANDKKGFGILWEIDIL
jgi:hypothetical protein